MFAFKEYRKVCAQCGTVFLCKHPGRLSCSRACARARIYGKRNARYHRKAPKTVACSICGTLFLAAKKNIPCCSAACQRKHTYRRSRARWWVLSDDQRAIVIAKQKRRAQSPHRVQWRREYQLKRRKQHREACLRYVRRNREAILEKARAKHAERRNDPAYRARMCENTKRYIAKHRDEVLAKKRARAKKLLAEHPEIVVEAFRAWQERSDKLRKDNPKLWKQKKREIYLRYHYRIAAPEFMEAAMELLLFRAKCKDFSVGTLRFGKYPTFGVRPHV